MNTRLRATMRVALWGLVLTGLAGSLVARAPGVLSQDARRADPVRVAYAGSDAALAGLVSASLASGQIDCSAAPYQVSVELSVSPNPVAPNASFQLLARAFSLPTRTPVRIERARYWYVKEDVDLYRTWFADRAEPKPNPNRNAVNQTPAGTVADLPTVTGSIVNGGDYDVIVEAVILMPDSTQQVCLVQFTEAINVAEVSTADFTVEEYITNTAGLVPLNDWVPLFGFTLKWSSEDKPAPRALTRLGFRLKGDPISMVNRGYRNYIDPQESDYLIFSIHQVYNLDGDGLPSGDNVQVGLPAIPGVVAYSESLYEWDSHGWPYDMPVPFPAGNTVAPNGLRYDINDNVYNLSFIYDSTDPSFPVSVNNPGTEPFGSTAPGPFRPQSEWITTSPTGNNYVVAVRLSSAWQTGTSLSMEVNNVVMQPYYVDLTTGQVRLQTMPLNEEGAPVDSFSPDFYAGDILAPEEAYSSSFGVFDVRGGALPMRYNSWNDQPSLYTPLEQFVRPRWDLATASLQAFIGEAVDMRQLFSVEAWVPLLGIDAHGMPGVGGIPQPAMLHMAITDVGGDPFGFPGNGGLFDPSERLEKFTTVGRVDAENATGEDFAYNGLWMWHDTNGNGQFDPPTPRGTLGIQFTDYPMYPYLPGTFGETQPILPGMMQWGYEPFPPGGGDPWWTIGLGFSGGRRRNPDDTPTGAMEGTPDVIATDNLLMAYPPKMDYFVVMRADSGFQDVSGVRGDGVGMKLGADTRCFVQPRRWNPKGTTTNGSWDGGILFNIQYRVMFDYVSGMEVNGHLINPWPDKAQEKLTVGETFGLRWQNAAVNDIVCDPTDFPCSYEIKREYGWWTERTHNQDTVKAVRCGVEVHDLVMTYATDNRWAKVTPIMAGQSLDAFNFYPYNFDAQWNGRSAISLWMDPAFFNTDVIEVPGYEYYPPGPSEYIWDDFQAKDLVNFYGIGELRFFHRHNPFMFPDYFDSFRGAGEWLMTHYAFETVPFKLEGDGLDEELAEPRSTFWPDPPSQPTLPRYSTWSGYQGGQTIVNWGDTSLCYLASEGAQANVPYNLPGASGAEGTYADDVYVFVVNGPHLGPLAGDLAGKWLVDNYGGRYYILSNSGNALTLREGHGAYLDKRRGLIQLNVPDYPYGVGVGIGNAVARGRWMIVEDTLPRSVYPRLEDWRPERLLNASNAWAARLLKQYIGVDTLPTAMLGFNLAGTDDPAVNAYSPISLSSATVAFWGPDFTPGQLSGLDVDGGLFTSGVLLYEDTNSNGVFDGPFLTSGVTSPSFTDRIVPLAEGSLSWAQAPEVIDLDDDYLPDDLSGDGVVFDGDPLVPADVARLTAAERAVWDGLSDRAWVLTLIPRAKWDIPYKDTETGVSLYKSGEGRAKDAADFPDYWLDSPSFVEFAEKAAGEKALDIVAGSPGADLFVVVRTSQQAKAFMEFRAVVPANLPTRTPDARKLAGLQMMPRAYDVVDTMTKHSIEESPLQDYYGHDMLPVNVRTLVLDTSSGSIQPGGAEAAVLGVDCSVNRPENIVARGQGTGAQTTASTFIPTESDITATGVSYYASGSWTANAVGLYLIGLSQGSHPRVEAYEITAVGGRTLTLRAGAPRADSAWYVVKDPSFLEQLVVEFYDVGRTGAFNLVSDLVPLDHEDPVNGQFSGVAVYRDNDWHPRNRNGVYDPPIRDAQGNVTEYIDLPVRLDNPPALIGAVGGEPEYQVKMTFASPGTDSFIGRDATPYVSQPRNRQWVPMTPGAAPTDADFGPDFFVVVRAATAMNQGDQFQAAIVSWGPNTPTEPDPDNFTVSLASPPLPGQNADEFDLFSEFPWGSRAVGYITLFQRPRPVRYWGFDKDKMHVVPRTDVDRSQDGPDFAALRNWIRTNTPAANRTQTITATPPATLDFTGAPRRQIVNGNVAFTLIGANQAASVAWTFGDGQTSSEINPVHIYTATGFYTVAVAVTNQYGVTTTVSKTDYIEILATPYVDFSATPTRGNITPASPVPALAVTFTDLSVGDTCFTPVGWYWNFGDGQSSTERNPVHRYTVPGIYDVTLTVTYRDNCNGGALITRQFTRENYIEVLQCVGCGGEGEGEGEGEGQGEGEGEGQADAPTADITFSTLVPDKESVMPLSDWVPLFRFTMSYEKSEETAENYAPRKLKSLTYWVRPDSRNNDELNYLNMGAPYPTDLLEFGLFVESKASEGAEEVLGPLNGILDSSYDDLMFTWDNLGTPVGEITGLQQYSGIVYELDFIGNGTAARPQFDVPAGEVDENFRPDGNSYIVAVRTSATWRSQLTMGVEVLDAVMVDPRTGSYPVDVDGVPTDTYSPNFWDGDILEDKQYYSSSFSVYDYIGTFSGVQQPLFFDAWNHPNFLYTPMAENSRPRWNKPDQLLDVVAGEFLQVRKLLGVDSWMSVMGINAQSTNSVHFADTEITRDISAKNAAQLREVNVILTDIGGDPYGAPGNGGFDPRAGLEDMTAQTWGLPLYNEEVFSRELTFNGAWVWHDTNNNGVFDAPTPNANGGLTFAGDYPMLANAVYGEELMPTWEYIPLPPGGGDPWWKISLRLWGGTRKLGNYGAYSKDFTEGYLEKTPDNLAGGPMGNFGAEASPDYFVVVRTDSGFRDISLSPGDGQGITYGADFRAFIEPRRFNPESGNWEGGIFVDSMIPAQGIKTGASVLYPWQNDPRWGEYEPWWPQRTFNQSTAKPVRVGVDVHDLVITYESDSPYRNQTDLFYIPSVDVYNPGNVDLDNVTLGGYTDIGVGVLSGFDQWMDPFGLEQIKFQNGHTVDVRDWRLFGARVVDFGLFQVNFLFDDTGHWGQFAYETVPFYSPLSTLGDAPPVGPRSSAYPVPPQQPALPRYGTWSAELLPGEYPRASQWRPGNAGARLLAQKVDGNSAHMPMLGVNLVASSDPVVTSTGEPVAISQITVAFWGPDFTPAMLRTLDPDTNDNQSLDSGVLLWEDADQNGIFLNTQDLNNYAGSGAALPLLDRIVPVTNVKWASQPELVDLDGDGRADDMDGNGIVDDADRAWVLTLYPRSNWTVPRLDGYEFEYEIPTTTKSAGASLASATSQVSTLQQAAPGAKALDPAVLQPGDDLFISISTSDSVARFSKIRAVIPANLPTRPDNQRRGGIQFFPGVNSSGTAFVKSNPDEDPIQDFYGHDMLEVNVPARIVDLTNRSAKLNIGGEAVPVLGLDLTTNRPGDILAAGNGGIGLVSGYRVPSAAWVPGAFAGDWLVDSGYETYEILGNSANEITLRAGTPRNGVWRVVRDPSFLEELTVELYQDGTNAIFNPLTDLLPLNRDQRISGVALYRDNDNHPENRNGYFDPGIDIPIPLDGPPRFTGQTADDIQVRFVFSTPGTDDQPLPREQQTRNRQWIQPSYGVSINDLDYGPDFFVVARAAQGMQEGDSFRAGIVSWGPNTPTEPDPDTWANLPGEDRNDFRKFREFQWAQRGLGFVTFFRTPPAYFWMDGAKAGVRPDASGFNWIRSHTMKKQLSGVLEARARVVGPTTIAIDSVSQTELPSQTLPGEPFRFVIYGKNFGARPVVVMSGYDVVVTGATNTTISLSISSRSDDPPVEPIVLLVRNTATGQEVSRSDLFSLAPGTPERSPKVLRVDPKRATRKKFPVTLYGEDLGDVQSAKVFFGKTLMPVIGGSPDGTRLVVGFPVGGMAQTGKMDVKVGNAAKNKEDILVDGFEYVNDDNRNKFLGFIGCAPGTAPGTPWADAAVMLAAAGLLALAGRRRRAAGRG